MGESFPQHFPLKRDFLYSRLLRTSRAGALVHGPQRQRSFARGGPLRLMKPRSLLAKGGCKVAGAPSFTRLRVLAIAR